MMTASKKNIKHDLDTKLLSECIYALNIARRQVLSYPPEHPMIANATNNLLDLMSRLLEFRSEITLGIARDTLMLDGQVLDASNPVFRDLAKNLFRMRIASLSINRELSENDVLRFFTLFHKPPEQLAEEGGIEQILKTSGFRGIRARGIDFGAFGTTEVDAVRAPKTRAVESDTALLWKSFATGIISDSIDPDGKGFMQIDDLDPELLAEVMNMTGDTVADSLDKTYEEAITSFLKETDQRKIRDQAYQETLGRLGKMVDKLNPELRRRFINSTLKSSAQRPEAAEALLQKIPQTALLDALEHMDTGSIEISQTMMDVLGKLSAHRGDDVSQSRVVGDVVRNASETAEQLSALFSEDRSDFFVPKDYQDALAVLASAKADHGLDKNQHDEIMLGLESHKIEKQFNVVILNLLERGIEPSSEEAIGQNLHEMVGYFLETGDFESLLSIYTQLQVYASGHPGEVAGSVHDTLQTFNSAEFADAVLDGLDTWGKAAHEGILSLVRNVGTPFADPLLDRLADEASMSRRRMFITGIIQIGPQVKDFIAARLKDDRWFLVRNLVIILRGLNDPEVVPLLGRLVDYGHPKVQYEVINAYLHYGDERANSFLVKELSGKNPASLLSATRLAEKSRDVQVIRHLAKLLNMRVPLEHETEIKAAAIKALLENAREEVLPELEKFLVGKKLFGGSRNNELKIRAVEILEKIGTINAGLLAGEVARSATGELAKAAEGVLVKIHRQVT